jgi:hypothetical protein
LQAVGTEWDQEGVGTRGSKGGTKQAATQSTPHKAWRSSARQSERRGPRRRWASCWRGLRVKRVCQAGPHAKHAGAGGAGGGRMAHAGHAGHEGHAGHMARWLLQASTEHDLQWATIIRGPTGRAARTVCTTRSQSAPHIRRATSPRHQPGHATPPILRAPGFLGARTRPQSPQTDVAARSYRLALGPGTWTPGSLQALQIYNNNMHVHVRAGTPPAGPSGPCDGPDLRGGAVCGAAESMPAPP